MWVVVGAAVVAGAGLYGASMQAGAAKDAAGMQAAAGRDATATQWAEFQKEQENLQPWLTQGTTAVNQLGQLMGPGGQLTKTAPTAGDLQMDPGYAFRTKAGVEALRAGSAAGGNFNSGNMGTALVNYGQNAASQEYQNAYNRWQGEQSTLYNRLAGVAGTGQTAANQINAAGQNYANNASQIAINQGNNQAAATIGSANAWAGGINNLVNQGISGYGAYNQNQLYNKYLDLQSGGGTYANAGGNINNVNFGNDWGSWSDGSVA